ncbi:hypothetical protein IW261DRAFT_1514737 [Armillaria novae-zelandiae]|uniref:Uncharacterized protein n=1 Tax=Armillaria novae-zelandiae TaxID=153914 RepID=A0AA39NS25_9AGAR|nr:hypothetical protein IW261DRAFT_1514737 [Armillaria novae-zelandiae]
MYVFIRSLRLPQQRIPRATANAFTLPPDPTIKIFPDEAVINLRKSERDKVGTPRSFSSTSSTRITDPFQSSTFLQDTCTSVPSPNACTHTAGYWGSVTALGEGVGRVLELPLLLLSLSSTTAFLFTNVRRGRLLTCGSRWPLGLMTTSKLSFWWWYGSGLTSVAEDAGEGIIVATVCSYSKCPLRSRSNKRVEAYAVLVVACEMIGNARM